jgi:hypothetical protein
VFDRTRRTRWTRPEPSTPVSSRPELASVGCGMPSVVKESIELSICPLFRCAGRFWPSDQSWPARASEQEQRVADPSTQPRASRRSICAWWRDEGSALEMSYSGGDRSHTKGHMIEPMQPNLAEAVRSAAVSCRAATGRTSLSRGPAHAQSAHWQLNRKSRATTRHRDSTVPPRSPTDIPVPTPSGQQTCRICLQWPSTSQTEMLRT